LVAPIDSVKSVTIDAAKMLATDTHVAAGLHSQSMTHDGTIQEAEIPATAQELVMIWG
jgi:hypothetical protein